MKIEFTKENQAINVEIVDRRHDLESTAVKAAKNGNYADLMAALSALNKDLIQNPIGSEFLDWTKGGYYEKKIYRKDGH